MGKYKPLTTYGIDRYIVDACDSVITKTEFNDVPCIDCGKHSYKDSLKCHICGPTIARRNLEEKVAYLAGEVDRGLYTLENAETLEELAREYTRTIDEAISLRNLEHAGVTTVSKPECWGNHRPEECQSCLDYVAWLELTVRIDKEFIKILNPIEIVLDFPNDQTKAK